MASGGALRRRAARKCAWVLCTMVAGVSTAVLSYALADRFHQQALRREVGDLADFRGHRFEQELHAHLAPLEGLNALFAASQSVEADEFDAYCSRCTRHHRGTLALVWMAFPGGPGQVSPDTMGVTTHLQRPGDAPSLADVSRFRAEFVYSATADSGPELGQPLPTQSEIATSVHDSCLDGKLRIVPVATGDGGDAPHFMAVLPVYGNGSEAIGVRGRSHYLLGVLVGWFDFGDVARSMVEADAPRRDLLEMTVLVAATDRLVFHAGGSGSGARQPRRPADGEVAAPARAGRPHLYLMSIGGCRLAIVSTPTEQFLLGRPNWNSWGAAVLALAATVLGVGYLGIAVNRAEEVERQVEARTAELRASEQRTATILRSALDCIVTIDRGGRIMDFNAAAEATFGFSHREARGRPFADLFSPPDRARLQRELACCVGRSQWDWIDRRVEVSGCRRDGQEFPVEVSTSVANVAESPVFTMVLRDVTERRRLQGQLMQAQKLEAVGQLAAGIAHEINTPTQYIGDNTRFLQDAFGELLEVMQSYEKALESCHTALPTGPRVDDARRHGEAVDLDYLKLEVPRAIEQSLEGIDRVSQIVRSMKEFAHPGAPEKTPVDLNRAIESTITVSRNEWRYVSDMQTRLAPDLPLVDCIPGEINQVVLNLIVNAAHAIADKQGDGDDKGVIEVSTARRQDWVEIRVRDTGCGIPPEHRERVFEPFFTTKEAGRGTGQGLAIARTVVVEKHQGSLTLETAVGVGTTFTVRLPLGDCGRQDEDRSRSA